MSLARGALVIHVGKRKGGARKAARGGVDTVASWNAENPTHPRAADGEFVSAVGAGHEAVADLLHGMVREHKSENTPLGKALLGRIGRAESPGDPTKPLRKKPQARASQEGWSAAMFGSEPLMGSHEWRKRQEAGIPSEAELSVMTVAQLTALADGKGLKLRGRTKKDKISSLREQLGSSAAPSPSHQLRDIDAQLKDTNLSDAKRSELLKRREALTGFKDDGLTPEQRIGQGRDFGIMQEGTDTERRRLKREAKEAKAREQSEKLTELTRKINESQDPAERAGLIWERHKLTQEMGVKVTSSASAQRVRNAGTKKETGKYSNPAGFVGTAGELSPDGRRSWREVVANPKPEDREMLRAHLSSPGMTVAKIKAFSDEHGGTWNNAGTKSQKIGRVTEDLVGYKLNSDAIRRSSTDFEDRNGLQPWLRERTMSSNPRAKNTWGAPTGKADEVHYHPDGEIGWAASRLGADEKLEVQGDSLVNRLDRIASDTVAGRTSPAQQIEELKKLHNELPDGPGKTAVRTAIRNLDRPVKPAPVTVPQGAPERVKKLVDDLAKIPLLSASDADGNATQSNQAGALWSAVQGQLDELAARQAAGRNLKIFFPSMEHKLVSNVPHESLEGAADIRSLILDAFRELKG